MDYLCITTLLSTSGDSNVYLYLFLVRSCKTLRIKTYSTSELVLTGLCSWVNSCFMSSCTRRNQTVSPAQEQKFALLKKKSPGFSIFFHHLGERLVDMWTTCWVGFSEALQDQSYSTRFTTRCCFVSRVVFVCFSLLSILLNISVNWPSSPEAFIYT